MDGRGGADGLWSVVKIPATGLDPPRCSDPEPVVLPPADEVAVAVTVFALLLPHPAEDRGHRGIRNRSRSRPAAGYEHLRLRSLL